MKLHINSKKKALLAFALAIAAGAAWAEAPVTSLTVKGRLVAPSCTVNAPDDGVYQFGKISPTMIKPGTTHTALVPQEKEWTIECDATTFMTLGAVDNVDGTASVVHNSNFGLDKVNETGKLGYYVVRMLGGKVDDADSGLFSTTGTTFINEAFVDIVHYRNGYRHGWSSAANTMKAGRKFSAVLRVSPYLGGTSTMNGPITETTELNGSMTLNFAFGL
ncbi:DUF1120 domain-containing protein [Dyella sp. BiH032]|uniref:DUF1120 domain-containing protein n=1 Tax=Dyella sp. BiH032 TaxID=3075430 RepID=UPI00289345BC|nr:DUF1120 domain-containing protein [Dyella sp. BiH032]WNL45000.1 DUF1120 domain-containing protein [Dyella sp. BiH032]